MESFTHGKQSKYLSDPIITIRDDRYVIPVKAEYKQKLVELCMTKVLQVKQFIWNPQV